MASKFQQLLYRLQLSGRQVKFVLDANSIISSALPPCLNELDGGERSGATLARLSELKYFGKLYVAEDTQTILPSVFVGVCEEKREEKEKKGRQVRQISEDKLLALLETTCEQLSYEIIESSLYRNYLINSPLCQKLKKIDWEDAPVLAAALYLNDSENSGVVIVSGDKHFGKLAEEIENAGLFLINPFKDFKDSEEQ